MVMTLCPRFASSTGKLPTTSPSPPVFDQGAHSVLTNTIFMGFVVFALYGASDAARVWTLRAALTFLRWTVFLSEAAAPANWVVAREQAILVAGEGGCVRK